MRRMWSVLLVLLLSMMPGPGCGKRTQGTTANKALPPPVRLSVAEQLLFHPKTLRGIDRYHFVSGKNGEFWILLQEMLKPLTASRLTKDSQSPFEPISPSNWNDVDRVSVANDGSGRPVVIMMGCVQDYRDSRVIARTWTGNQWTDPVELDQFDGSGTFGNMLALLDSKGRIHVVYDRRLSSGENYSTGLIIVDGEFPDKCFHAFWEGNEWSRGKSTTGRGRFYVDPVSLSELPDGRVCLVMKVHPIGRIKPESEYVGYQVWDGRQWSGISEKQPDGAAIEPLLRKRDLAGRIIDVSQDESLVKLRLGNGHEWTESLTFPCRGQAAQVLLKPDGNIYIIVQEDADIRIQRILLTPIATK